MKVLLISHCDCFPPMGGAGACVRPRQMGEPTPSPALKAGR